MKKNLLVTLSDEVYLDGAKQLFSSVYHNAGWKGDYMLLSLGIPEKKLQWFRKKGILVKRCEMLYDDLIINISDREKAKWHILLLTKFHLFTPYFKKWRKVIYLDADIIVRASLDELIKVKGFAAIINNRYKLKNQFNNNENRLMYKHLKGNYDLNEKSFNAGVFTFNTDIINKDSFSRLKNLFLTYKDISLYGDQGILNLFFYNKWRKLPIVYNLQESFFKNKDKIRPIISHFIEHDAWDLDPPFRKEWENNLKKAELIDLKNIPNARRWTREEIRSYSRKIMIRKFFWDIGYKVKSEINGIYLRVDRLIGLGGLVLKEYIPSLYCMLKKNEKKFISNLG